MSDIYIALADDQKLFSQTLALLVSTVPNFKLLFTAMSGEEFLEQLPRHAQLPQIALLDIDMPGMNGLELNRRLKAEYPDIRTIILSVHLEEELIVRAMEDGAAAYLAKNCDKDDLIKAITTVHREGFHINPLTLNALRRPAIVKNKTDRGKTRLPAGITRRENEILQLICQEYSNAEIAEKLFLSIRTVEGHRINLLTKTGCRNTAGLVIFALKNQLLKIPINYE